MVIEITQAQRQAVRDAIQPGLVSGLGNPEPGRMCVEAAICFALGEPHGDEPSCVAPEDRRWAVRINDAAWPSNEARSRALLPVALASMGTAGTDRSKWVTAVVEGTIRRVVPLALRAAADSARAPHAGALRRAAERCEKEGTFEAARDARSAAEDAASAAYFAANVAYAAEDAADYAEAAANAAASATNASYAANAAANAAAHADRAARAVNAADYANAAASAAYSAANASAANASAAYASAAYAAYGAYGAAKDEVLSVAVEVALGAYRAEGRI